jgi:methionyl-tRNA synthetase
MNQSVDQAMSKFYLTTPIYYPNARPHVGSAYTTIVCDVIARYKRMCGYDVAFLTGTDEHGEKLRRAAEEAGKSPAEFVAEKRKLFTSLWQSLGIPQYSSENPAGYRFVHTSQNPDHVESVHWMIRRAREYKIPFCPQCQSYLQHEDGLNACTACGGSVELLPAIYSKRYEGRYCIYDERYVSDGTDPTNCDICGRPAELISEENYFFRLSAFQDRLLGLYKQPEFVQPDFRCNEVLSFVKSGLRDISISRRRLKWGIPWPDDPEQVVYVWYDALTSYLTGIGFRGKERSKDFENYWMDKDADVVHMIGKDIIRFHAVYWPAFLLAAGLPLPKTIFAHGWIYYEQDKMSKSKGNVVYPEPIVNALDSFGAPGNDALRYYLLRDTPFGQDASFSYDGLVQRYNSDLANDLGNLANRTITMINRYFDGLVPKPVSELADPELRLRAGLFGGCLPDPRYLTTITGLIQAYTNNFERFYLQPMVGRVWDLISLLNGYLVERQPWKLGESDDDANRSLLTLTLYTASDLLRTIAIMLYPILPFSAERLWKQLGCEGDIRDQRSGDLKWQGLEPGTKVGKPEPIFPRLDKTEALARLHEFAEADLKSHRVPSGKEKTVETPSEQKPGTTGQTPAETAAAPAAATPATDKISIEDFAKVEMRVGEILSAEPIPKADKLLKLQVDIGTEVRQVCAGIAEHYRPEQLVGMKVVLVTNLQPRKLRGVESNGMIVAASVGEEGRPVLATFKEDVPKGAKLR